MNYKNLGRTGVMVSPLCLGTMNFGYRTPEADAISIIQRVLDDGINFIDTANFYGQPVNNGRGQGITETIVGKALKGRRDRVVLATKVCLPTADFPEDPNARGISRRSIIAECEKSLKRLDTDYIDLYQLHRPQRDIPIDETLRALDDLVRSGKVRYIGTSMFPAWQIIEGLWISERNHLNRFVTEQPRYNLLMRGLEREVIPMALEYNIAILPYSPLAGGILTGKYRPGEAYSEESRMADEAWGEWAQGFMVENVHQKVEALTAIAGEKNCTLSQLALAWVMQQPAITSVIIGPRTVSQYEDNLGALKVEITDDDRQCIDEIVAPGQP
ncbi:MAG: aldo/keto reductase [Chloroflexi bacterium]|nr:aldo/keto reductase [Chloroflexota bacterium]